MTDLSPQAYDVSTFCKVHSIGRTFFYRLLKEGRGPKIMKIGSRRLISVEAAREWRSALERHDE